eukprot:2180498-Rhodomonas_salina.4
MSGTDIGYAATRRRLDSKVGSYAVPTRCTPPEYDNCINSRTDQVTWPIFLRACYVKSTTGLANGTDAMCHPRRVLLITRVVLRVCSYAAVLRQGVVLPVYARAM